MYVVMHVQGIQDTNKNTPGNKAHQASKDSSGPHLFLSQYPGCGGGESQLPELIGTKEELTAEGSKDDVVARLKATIEELRRTLETRELFITHHHLRKTVEKECRM